MGEGPTCCCCIPIGAGVIILAVLGLLGGLKTFGDGVAFFVRRAEITAGIEEGPFKEDQQSIDAALKLLMGLSIADLIIGPLNFILSIVLLKGVTDRKPAHLRIWVKVNIGILILAAAVLLIISGIGVIAGIGALVATMALTLFVVNAWKGYYIFVVHKFARIMEDADRPMQGIAYGKP